MNPKPRLKGFTLLETLLALALTGLVLALGFWVYRIMGQYHQLYQGWVEQSFQRHQVVSVIRTQAQSADQVRSYLPEAVTLLRRKQLQAELRFTTVGLLCITPLRTDTLSAWGFWELDTDPRCFRWVDTITDQVHVFHLLPVGRAQPLAQP